MLEWLENGPDDRPADKSVWGMEKSIYNFKDLEQFLEHEEKRGRGNRKAQGDSNDKEEGGSKLKGGDKKKKKQVK